jgi:hypothetical protein
MLLRSKFRAHDIPYIRFSSQPRFVFKLIFKVVPKHVLDDSYSLLLSVWYVPSTF